MGHEFAFGLLIFRSYDVFMLFGYEMNKFSKKQLIHQIFEETLQEASIDLTSSFFLQLQR